MNALWRIKQAAIEPRSKDTAWTPTVKWKLQDIDLDQIHRTRGQVVIDALGCGPAPRGGALAASCRAPGYLTIAVLRVRSRAPNPSHCKGPILRGLAARAPYLHHGSAATLSDVVEFYNQRFNLGFTDQQKSDLVEFLRTL